MKIRFLVIILAMFAFLASCEDCEDCGKPGAEPNLRVQFIPRDSLAKLTILRNAIQDTIRGINDSLMAKDEEKYKPILARLNQELEVVLERRDIIARNRVRIDSIHSVEAKRTLYFSDTVDFFRLPLNIKGDTSSLVIYLHNRRDTLVVAYNNQIGRRNQSIQFILQDLTIIGNSYDSLKATCRNIEFSCTNKKVIDCLDNECISNETTLKIFF
jgi:hypothetical protein